MTNELRALIFAGLGTFTGALIQYYFQRRSAAQQERREIIEVYLLQLQNAVESLYYRLNNLLDWGGKTFMADDYYRATSIYILARILAQENLLITQGIYAKLSYDERFKRSLKLHLHALNCGLDDQNFLYYHRVQLAEMLVREGKLITYTNFLALLDQQHITVAVVKAEEFIVSASNQQLEMLRQQAKTLVLLLELKTKVPSAITLSAVNPNLGYWQPFKARSREA
ncbi:hypothetical protein IQ273_30765 [Nodosilinea sp. LEGE 07298]|jgi:hypothetical protein|uniref:hypothetical protein n=1 Tax=Nodosilinea sp. LEGE 07298 TaxID=2777970 RepID=UPI00188170D9|nr:hypothetical protein [Nodosilinea sp. LEGE 07298]MBE9113756.1 hypothetical protein [Nodosilinea sp. LEGE 07298]